MGKGVEGHANIEADLAFGELNCITCDSFEGDDGLYEGAGDVDGAGGDEEAGWRESGIPKVVSFLVRVVVIVFCGLGSKKRKMKTYVLFVCERKVGALRRSFRSS